MISGAGTIPIQLERVVGVHCLPQMSEYEALDTTLVCTQGTPGDLQRATEMTAWA